MTVFTYSQARQNFAKILNIARREGTVRIRRRDGQVFSISPLKKSRRSPFDVKGIKTRVTTKDILQAVRESRAR